MSVNVDLADLAAAVDEHPFAYLLTIGDDGRPHVLAVVTAVTGAAVRIDGVGRAAPANVTARPDVTLVFPPAAPRGMSLLVDGVGRVEGATIVVEATRAVRHRAAPVIPG